MKKTKHLLFVMMVIVIPLFLTGCNGCGSQPEPAAEATPTPEETYEKLSLEEKPFVSLIPSSDGKELTLSLDGVEGYDTVEYEIVYFSENRQLGLVGEIDLEGKSSGTKSGLTLGSCSRGVCTYDANVHRGNLTLRLQGQKKVKLLSSFSLEAIPGSGGEISSVEEKVTVTFAKGGFFVILMDPIGLPHKQKPEPEINAGPYALFSLAKLGSFKVEFAQQGKILGWNESEEAWEQIPAGESTSSTTFIVVKE